ncbi:MAG: asparagine synthase (glutamine-hydrolyzing) [Lachnospirales bacterium]
MCGIAGFCSFDTDYTKDYNSNLSNLINMRKALYRRGNDDNGEYLDKNIGLAQTRLTIRDLVYGKQPMTRYKEGNSYTIIYNGEIYQTDKLKYDLENKGYKFETTSDTEIILYAFMEYGVESVKMLNGIFAYAIWDDKNKKLYLFRDYFGVKPLFYTFEKNSIIFASEIKGLFANSLVSPKLDSHTLREIFGIFPARSEGDGVFKNIFEIKYGHYGIYDINGFKEHCYWKLESKEHNKSYEETVYDVKNLITTAVEGQMVSDVPVCSFLSGGLDSCIVTAIASKYLEKQGKEFNTFSFDFKDNNKYFVSNNFQPEQDRKYVDIMLDEYNLNHNYLECDEEKLIEYLYKSVDSKDLPGMADVDGSMLYFCSLVSKHNKVTLTGECADEIFGGYPWFHREEFINAQTFPWSINIGIREKLFNKKLNLKEYVNSRYKKSLSEVPKLYGENKIEERQREISYLNLKWFMTTLLDRMDRASMYNRLEARVPYADYRIVEYMWNVPWEYKNHNGITKGLLRDAAKDLLSDKLLYRKKSPYPKTYSPVYTKKLIEIYNKILENKNSPILEYLNYDEALKLIDSQEYNIPWFGQLMKKPQMIAYIIQVNYWLKKFF